MKRLDDLVAKYALPAAARRQLGLLLRELAQPIASTSVHDPVRAVDVHIADSLVGLEVDAVREARAIADLGAGAGLPALVLACALPDATIFAVESVGKKCAFITETAEVMGLTNVTAIPMRAEEWSGGIGRMDVVTARAVAGLPVLLEYAAPLLVPGGLLVAWKGDVEAGERADASAAATELRMSEPSVKRVKPFPDATRRTLYLSSKVGDTPDRYPRRPGMATKKPLRANP